MTSGSRESVAMQGWWQQQRFSGRDSEHAAFEERIILSSIRHDTYNDSVLLFVMI